MAAERKRSALGWRIHTMRTEKGIRQRDMACALKVSQGTLSNWERGKHEPDTETLKRLASYFRISIDNLLDYSAENQETIQPIRPSAEKEADNATASSEAILKRLESLDEHTKAGLLHVVQAVLDMLP